MSLKNRDEHNRWRNKTIAFRVSPEENEQIERYVQLSGLTKQDYITRRLTHRDVVVQGNPRVFKALRNQLAEVLWKLQRIETGGAVNDELLDLIEMIADILGGMKEEFECPTKKEMTAPNVSVGADTEQSSQNLIDNSLTDFDPNFKRFDAVQRKFLQMMDPSYLKTMSMSELLDNVYQSKPSLVDGLLYRGTYLFVGAPKLGKSFLSLRITSAPARRCGIILSTKAQCCTLPWRAITAACKSALTGCSARQKTRACSSLFLPDSSAEVWMNSSPIFYGSIQTLLLSLSTRFRRCVKSAETITVMLTTIKSSLV